jgi:hypothetical protein
MTDHSNDDEDRRKLLADGDAGPLGADEAADLALLTDLLGDPSTWAQASPGLEDAVVRAVATAPTEADPAEAQTHRRRRVPARRWRIASVAAVAAVAIGVIVASFGGGPSADFNARLAATEVVPNAHASAVITRNDGGFRIALDAKGLAPLPAGQYYQAWLKNSSGSLVPVGTFSSSDDRVTLWSGVSPADFPILSITIERDDNNQASSGHVVLAGPVLARR